MQTRGFRLLLGVIVMVGAAILVRATDEHGARPAAPGARAFPGLASRLGDLTWVRLTQGAVKLDFAAIGGRWAVVLTGEDGVALTLKRDAPGAKLAVADPRPDVKFKSDAVIADPAAALAGLDLDDVTPAADLAVPQSGVATAVFTTFDGLTVTLRLLQHDNTDWASIEAAGSGAAETESQAINARLAPWRYAIPAGRAKLLRTRLADLVEPAKGS